MKSFEERAEAVLACVYRGIHHAPEIKKFPGEGGRWEVNHLGHLLVERICFRNVAVAVRTISCLPKMRLQWSHDLN